MLFFRCADLVRLSSHVLEASNLPLYLWADLSVFLFSSHFVASVTMELWWWWLYTHGWVWQIKTAQLVFSPHYNIHCVSKKVPTLIWKKMQTYCILKSLTLRVVPRTDCKLKIFNSLLFDLLTFAINLWRRKFVTADVTAVSLNNQHGMKRREQDFDKTFIWNQYEERLAILNTENIKIGLWKAKLEATKMQYVCIFAMSAEYLQKIWIFNFPR